MDARRQALRKGRVTAHTGIHTVVPAGIMLSAGGAETNLHKVCAAPPSPRTFSPPPRNAPLGPRLTVTLPGCAQALLNYIDSGLDISQYWRTLHENGIDKDRLMSFDRKIHSEPSFRQDQCDGLRRDLTKYLTTLKAVHSGADLSSAAGYVFGYKQDQCKGKDVQVSAVGEVATDRLRELVDVALLAIENNRLASLQGARTLPSALASARACCFCPVLLAEVGLRSQRSLAYARQGFADVDGCQRRFPALMTALNSIATPRWLDSSLRMVFDSGPVFQFTSIWYQFDFLFRLVTRGA